MYHDDRERELVGILVGKIIEPGDVLCFRLYVLNDGHHIVNIEEYHDVDAGTVAIDKADKLGVRAKWVQCTDIDPRWYYVQLDRRYPPTRLCQFRLPWSVYSHPYKN
jgi:hypothetical protein